MIESITLKDYRLYDKFTLALAPAVTTLVGPSDCGKSTVVSALYFVCLNQPPGTDAVRHGKKSLAVRLAFDGRQLLRTKSERANAYELDGSRFAAFGASVPPEVSEALKVSEINFQLQLDPPFWLTLPPPELARQLNGVVDLSLIDDSLSRASSAARSTKAALEAAQKRLEEAQRVEARSRPVEALGDAVTRLRALLSESSALRARRDALARSLAALRALDAPRTLPDPSAARAKARELRALTSTRDDLCQSLDRLRRAEAASREASKAREASERRLAEARQTARACPTCGRPY